MTGKEKKRYAEVKNRLGYTSFIKDHQEMADDYEKILEIQDGSFIDELDHYYIATVNELGIRKEMEIKALKKEIKRLKKVNQGYEDLMDLNDSIGGC